MFKYIFSILLVVGVAHARTSDQIYRMPGSGNLPSWGAIDLSKANAVASSLLGIVNGGTGQTVWNSHGVVYFDGTILNSATSGTTGQLMTSNGASANPTMQSLPGNTAVLKTPTVQTFTTGSGTYTKPASVLYLRVTAVSGGGGGGGVSNTTAAGGINGGTTTFGSVLSITGGLAGNSSNTGVNQTGGFGGSPTISSGIIVAGMNGSDGANGTAAVSGDPLTGGSGGASYFGGNGRSGWNGAAGQPAKTNSGSGGGGGSTTGSGYNGGGGGAGGFGIVIITSPLSTYSYSVGTGGAGGTGGVSNGGAGAAGYIVVEEFYQ